MQEAWRARFFLARVRGKSEVYVLTTIHKLYSNTRHQTQTKTTKHWKTRRSVTYLGAFCYLPALQTKLGAVYVVGTEAFRQVFGAKSTERTESARARRTTGSEQQSPQGLPRD